MCLLLNSQGNMEVVKLLWPPMNWNVLKIALNQSANVSKTKPKPFLYAILVHFYQQKTRAGWCDTYFCDGFFSAACLLYGLPHHFSFRFPKVSPITLRRDVAAQRYIPCSDPGVGPEMIFHRVGVVENHPPNPSKLMKQIEGSPGTESQCYMAIMSPCPPAKGLNVFGSMLNFRSVVYTWPLTTKNN